jgi:hypothetical protein
VTYFCCFTSNSCGSFGGHCQIGRTRLRLFSDGHSLLCALLFLSLSQLPYLDYKREYLWGALQVSDVADRKVETIVADEENTVRSLRDKLLVAVRDGNGDGGLPILQREEVGCKMVGYIGTSELEHALSE